MNNLCVKLFILMQCARPFYTFLNILNFRQFSVLDQLLIKPPVRQSILCYSEQNVADIRGLL